MLASQVADTLRDARRAAGLTQREAALRAGVSHRLWAEVERGERPNVSMATALRLLTEVGVVVRLTDPSGATREITDVNSARTARRLRASHRRASWTGRQIRLSDEREEPVVSDASSAGLSAVSRVSEQAFAVYRAAAPEVVRPRRRHTPKPSSKRPAR